MARMVSSELPARARTPRYASKLLKSIPFTAPSPSRKVALAWRTSFDRPLAVDTLAAAIRSVKMPCLRMAPPKATAARPV